MKKIFFYLMFLTISLSAHAQNTNDVKKTYDYYCVYYGQLQISGRVKPQKLIWGELKKEVKLTNPKGEEIEFNNMIDVANYLAKRGWRFIDNETYHDRFYVIFAKTVSSDEEAKEGLYFDIDFK